jgi:uncharacterized cupredoxin-like copper-binding protein
VRACTPSAARQPRTNAGGSVYAAVVSTGPVSRAPVIALIVFGVVAVALVFIGLQLSLAPAPAVDIAAPGTREQPRDVAVIMRDFRFDPMPFVLVPGETVRITIFNGGLIEHDFVLGDAQVQQAWADADAAATPPALLATAPPASVAPDTGGVRVVLGSGQQAVVEYTVPEQGHLLLFCHIPGHIEQGMIGDVELRAEPDSGRDVPTTP